MYPGCKYRGSFNRKYDLTRHMRKHEDATGQCPVRHCDRSFHRYDKLKIHLETQHNDTEEAICPVCNREIPFLLIKFHIGYQDYVDEKTDVVVRACHRKNYGLRSCPIPSCANHTKMVHASKLQAHLQEHEPNERASNFDIILAAGYHPESLDLVCPVCKAHAQSVTDFQEHMESEHIFTDRNRFNEIFQKHPVKLNKLLEGKPVMDHWDKDRIDAHIEFLRPHSDYAAHRLDILRLWPGFVIHLLFDDYASILRGNCSKSWLYIF